MSDPNQVLGTFFGDASFPVEWASEEEKKLHWFFDDLVTDPYMVIIVAFVWSTLMAYFGWFLGWLNIVLTFPKVEG